MSSLRMRRKLKEIASLVFGRYQLNRIYFKDLHQTPLDAPANLEFVQLNERSLISELAADDLKTHAWYARPGALGYGIVRDRRLVCMCWYWMKNDPRTPARLFSELKENEPLMVDLITSGDCRGQGYASSVVRYSEQQLRAAGYQRLWTWVWHSNRPSMRTFEKSGWQRVEFVIEIEPFRKGKLLQIRFAPNRFPRCVWTTNQIPAAETNVHRTATTINHAVEKVADHLPGNLPYASK